MKQPPRSVRLSGSRLGAATLSVCGVLMIDAWAQGPASFWIALIGLALIFNAFSSRRRVKIYNAWLKEWNSVGTFGRQPAKRKKRILPALTLLGLSLFIGFVTFWPEATGRPDLRNEMLWAFCGLCVLVGIVARARRRSRNGGVPGDAAIVSWMLSGAMDSPSRKEATKHLPEYAARVLTVEPGIAGVVPERDSHY
jgi:hypothetical protein